MSSETEIIGLYREFTNALTEIVAENAAVSPARRGRVARAHAAFKRHPSYSEHEFCAAVETAFMQWESLQNAGLLVHDMFAHSQAAGDYQPSGPGFGGGPSQSIEFVYVGCVRLGKQTGLP